MLLVLRTNHHTVSKPLPLCYLPPILKHHVISYVTQSLQSLSLVLFGVCHCNDPELLRLFLLVMSITKSPLASSYHNSRR